MSLVKGGVRLQMVFFSRLILMLKWLLKTQTSNTPASSVTLPPELVVPLEGILPLLPRFLIEVDNERKNVGRLKRPTRLLTLTVVWGVWS